MTIDAGLKPEGAPERSPIAGAGAPSGVGAGSKRYSVQRKMAVVARLLRGEPLDVVAREANVSVAVAGRRGEYGGAPGHAGDPRRDDPADRRERSQGPGERGRADRGRVQRTPCRRRRPWPPNGGGGPARGQAAPGERRLPGMAERSARPSLHRGTIAAGLQRAARPRARHALPKLVPADPELGPGQSG